MDGLLSGLATVFQPLAFFYCVLGTVLGIAVGAIPGLTGAMLIALTLPLTYYMTPTDAVVLLISMYVGAITGGLITATLLRMPGTPSNVMTTFDGYPMARAGKPGRALGLGIAASFVGGLVSWVFLWQLSKPLSIWATRFGPFEYFTLIMMAMVLIASVSQGSMVKGLIAGLLGMLVSMPGVDPSSGQPRLTFDWYMLNGGLKLLPVLIGVFAVSQIISDILELGRKVERVEASSSGILIRLRDYRKHGLNMLRSSLIGTFVGILPGVGASIGSVIAYTAAKNVSRTPERFGQGAEEGVVASEAANNATVGGALVPLIAMGIPGSVIDAILIGALMVHSIQPGPTLFLTNADVVWAMIATALVANFVMLAVMLGTAGWVARLAYLPRSHLLPVIVVFCIVGSFGLDNTMFDVWVMLIFGLIGFALERARYPLGPFVIGFVLAPLMEEKLRSGLMMTAGDITPIFTRPIAAVFLLCAVLLLVWPLIGSWRRRPTSDSLAE
ncbi:MAG: tripartite tricarboxylate transporter permease [Geminicoccaceae bacterium]|nr:tripartite tricarboxylate transporter permease [Geminicoccaceae bacterium]